MIRETPAVPVAAVVNTASYTVTQEQLIERINHPLKLNIGGGTGPELAGYEIVDRKVGKEAYPLDYADDSVDEVRASHILEHFSHRIVGDVIRDWVRVLKPGGRLQISVPDFQKCAKLYMDRTNQPVEMFIMGGQTDDNDYHKSLWDQTSLTDAMKSAGLNDIRGWASTIPDNAARGDVSINLEGFKRQPVKVANVQAIISMPRLCFTENAFGWLPIIRMGIPITKSTGVFWGQCMTRLMELTSGMVPTPNAKPVDVKYLLTLDYDTVFHQRDVEDLYMLMESHPEAAAICALQMGRDRNTVLLTVKGPDGKNMSSIEAEKLSHDLLKIDTGHFGLTMIRVEALKKLEKPWFVDKPDENGTWGENRIDADIHFWRQFAKAGLELYQSTRIVIGHLQQVVTWPSRSYQPVFQYLPEFQKHGMPWPCAR
jgi:hypothetical protein